MWRRIKGGGGGRHTDRRLLRDVEEDKGRGGGRHTDRRQIRDVGEDKVGRERERERHTDRRLLRM